MNKKHLFALLLLLLMMPTVYAHAAETKYNTQGRVGFTGVWTTPPSSSGENVAPAESKPTLPKEQSILPKTGDATNSSVITSFAGMILLFLITVYKKHKRREAI
ncbi:LPXTG cell wall anchor domain-containing protein [Lactococcus allomyrinae]|uniref:LPXTG cell wall anchor domain-containing protein n=1 Tax=Lactococcus allomyrinae TaxID=2419773 RepID=A0A387BD12_9LACT|nr:LPXTG cell wall anchor domain-containing protein [Lactococcus allomyrinae]AYG00368.1 LPXTG cell wall anchor domain-containing protein [Lactococcus allomyrinae]AYG00860.1 LPXTG cell wall anchor domain-containing protein [Lactococcus allomyrinae]